MFLLRGSPTGVNLAANCGSTSNFNFKVGTKEEVIRQSEEFRNAPNKTTANEIAKRRAFNTQSCTDYPMSILWWCAHWI